MIIAVLADIHANYEALEAVYRDISGRQVETVLCAGDLVGYGPSPNEVINFIRERGIITVKGNYDDGTANSKEDCGCRFSDDQQKALGYASICWTNSNVDEANKKYLGSLSPYYSFMVEGKKVLLVHGSPDDPLLGYLDIDRDTVELEIIAQNSGADIIIFGHTHIPYHLILDGIHLINAGSAGRPKDGDPRACYALIDINGEKVEVDFVRIPYEVEKTVQKLVQVGLPTEFAEVLRTGTTNAPNLQTLYKMET